MLQQIKEIINEDYINYFLGATCVILAYLWNEKKWIGIGRILIILTLTMLSGYLFNTIVAHILPDELAKIKEFVSIISSVGGFMAWTYIFEKDKYKQIFNNYKKNGNDK